ncbi:MAG: membrane protein insertase YidC [Thermoleophilia bacterium]|nr:membrane protein insertase YidC [Thermoleophilia bacterium]
MNPLTPIEDALRWVLDRLHENVGLTYGWSIVVLTLIVRAALLPLVIKQYRSMRQMQIIAPQIKEVQRKYKDDRRKQQEEVMRLYSENNANPFASCLPMLAQLPVFFALYYVLRSFSGSASDGTDLSFLWIVPDITTHLKDLGVVALVIGLGIYGLSQLLSTELSFEPHTPNTQRRIMRLLPIPIVLTALQFPFPAGLGVYWVTTNLWTAAQMLIIKHIIGLHIAHHPEELPGGPKTSRTAPKEKAQNVAAVAEPEPAGSSPSDAAAGNGGGTPQRQARGGGDANRRKPRPRGQSGGQGGAKQGNRRPPKKRK